MFFITNNLKYKYLLKLNQKYSNIQYKLNLFFNNKIDNNLKIAVYSYCIKNGGRARMTTLLINYLNKINFFNIYLFTRKKKEDNEYIVNNIICHLFYYFIFN